MQYNIKIFKNSIVTCYTGNQLEFRDFYICVCQMMDVDIQAYSYKNSACKRCNEFLLSMNIQKSSRFVTTYRDLFSFSELFSNKMKTFGKVYSEITFRDVFEPCCLYF